METKSILFLGGGNMASAIISALTTKGFPGRSIGVCDKNAKKTAVLQDKYGIKPVSGLKQDLPGYKVLVLAVKPQQLPELLEEIKPLVKDQTVISIAAGVKTKDIKEMLGTGKIIRVMPNTPVKVGTGVCGIFVCDEAKDSEKFAKDLFETCGTVVMCPREEMIEGITAVSGSGPAYVFRFIEALEQGAIGFGFNLEDARKLALMTVFGAGSLAIESADSPAELRKKVSSKGGTTLAALDVLEKNNFEGIIRDAMEACRKRAVELGDEFSKKIEKK